MTRKSITCTGILLFCLTVASPVLGQVSGVVKESGTDQLLGDVTVFVNRTSISTVSNSKGEFSLTGISPGFVDLVLYKDGYGIFKSPIRIQEGRAFKLTLKLVAGKNLPATDVKPGKDNKEDIRLFESFFFGITPFAQRCKIVNRKAFTFFSIHDTLKIHLHQPLVVENQALGFQVTYYSEIADVDIRRIPQPMILKFDTLAAADLPQRVEWHKNRQSCFLGSRRHLFLALINGQLEEQGFELTDEREQRLNTDSLVSPNKVSGYTVLKLKNRTGVRYFADDRNTADPFSWLTPKADLAANSNGLLLNDRALDISGSMSSTGIAEALPQNYEAGPTMDAQKGAGEIIRRLQEKAYVQTDKPYYYPGEVMWFKTYIDYEAHEYRDSLSRVLYVELINPQKEIIMSRIAKIDSGMAKGDFILPDSLASGTYYLRAYTNLMLNFGEAGLFLKTIPVVKITDKVDPGQGAGGPSSSPQLSVTADKSSYKTREKIKLTIVMKDRDQGRLASHLSVAVTDALQVIPIPEKNTIADVETKSDKKIRMPKKISYPLEQGLSFSGQFLNDKGKKEMTTLSIIQGNFENLIERNTDKDGFFRETGYQFYDTMDFSIAARNAKGKPYGNVKILPREVAPMTFKEPENHLAVINTNVLQRVPSEYDAPRNAKMLQEVSVTARRITASEFVTRKYGRPSRMFSGDKLIGTDMMDALIGRIAGLKILYTTYQGIPYRLLSMGHGILPVNNNALPPPEPLIYVDGAYRGGGTLGMSTPAADVLVSIDPVLVDHIEIINTANTMIGIEGGGGLIAIFTKPGGNPKTLKGIRIPGYTKPRDFKAPDYDNTSTNTAAHDYRSTIYWNPSVRTSAQSGETQVAFFAADLPGRYRIVVEGVTEEGEPVRCVQFIEVDDR